MQFNESTIQRSQIPLSPNIFEYHDYRQFLKDWFQWKKSVSPSFSGAVFAKRAGINSHTLLGMVIRSQRNLGYGAIRAFAKALNLKAREKAFFEKLVLMNQSKNSEEKAEFFKELIFISGRKVSAALNKVQDYDRYLSQWYIVAIREMFNLADFQLETEWIYNKLKKRVPKKEIESAISTLAEIGLIKLDYSTAKYVVSEPSIDFDSEKADFTIRNYHKKYLELSKDFLDLEDMSQRDMSSLTFCVSEEKLKELKELLRDLRIKLNAEEANDPGLKKYLVTLNTQLLVLTNKEG